MTIAARETWAGQRTPPPGASGPLPPGQPRPAVFVVGIQRQGDREHPRPERRHGPAPLPPEDRGIREQPADGRHGRTLFAGLASPGRRLACCEDRRMHETDADLAELQELLNASYAGAGRHLLSIHTPE